MEVPIFDERRLRTHVRIWRGEIPIGSGFVVGEREIMTCAHVVAESQDSRDRLRDSWEAPLDFVVELDMPLGGRRLRASLIPGKWRPELTGWVGDDAAVLRLLPGEELPDGARIVGKMREVKEDDFIRGFGVSQDQPTGVIIRGRYQDLVTPNRFHMIAEDIDEAIRPGCSGAAAWASRSPGVAGMVVEMQQNRVGRVVPVTVLDELWRLPWEEDLERRLARPQAQFPSASRKRLSTRLGTELRTFDRENQIQRFDLLLNDRWDKSRKPVICMIAGLEPDKPEWCRDKCRSSALDRRLKKMKFPVGRVDLRALKWPDEAAFDVDLHFDVLRNSVGGRIDARGDTPDAFRAAFNRVPEPILFHSTVSERLVRSGAADHVELLRRWMDFWTEVGLRPLGRPFVHFLVLTLETGAEPREAARPGEGGQDDFYNGLLANLGVGERERLPPLAPFKYGEVEGWLNDFATRTKLSQSNLIAIRSEAQDLFRRNPAPRMADLEAWLEELNL